MIEDKIKNLVRGGKGKSYPTQFAVIMTFLYLLSVNVSVYADGDTKKRAYYNQQLEQLKKAKRITVFLNTPYTGYTSRPYAKATEQLFTCQYISSKPSDIEGFVNIFKQASIEGVTEIESHLPIIGASAHFSMFDGKDIEVLLGREYVNENLLDGVIIGLPNNSPITIAANNSNHQLMRDIFNWAKDTKETRAGQYYYQPKVVDEIQRQWIFKDAARLGRSGMEALRDMEEMYKRSQQKALEIELNRCQRIPAIQYYRSDRKSICKAITDGLPIPYSGESSDFCATGWQLAN